MANDLLGRLALRLLTSDDQTLPTVPSVPAGWLVDAASWCYHLLPCSYAALQACAAPHHRCNHPLLMVVAVCPTCLLTCLPAACHVVEQYTV
jgi:hypothetical protein